MRHASNCPAFPEYSGPGQPVSHSKPVHHTGLIRDLPAACVWAQLDWEREPNDGGPRYLDNLEARSQELNLCPGCCLRELDHPFMTEVDSLRQRAEEAQHKLGGIASRLPDDAFRLAVVEILERTGEAGHQA
jgi:hypothetical protein